MTFSDYLKNSKITFSDVEINKNIDLLHSSSIFSEIPLVQVYTSCLESEIIWLSGEANILYDLGQQEIIHCLLAVPFFSDKVMAGQYLIAKFRKFIALRSLNFSNAGITICQISNLLSLNSITFANIWPQSLEKAYFNNFDIYEKYCDYISKFSYFHEVGHFLYKLGHKVESGYIDFLFSLTDSTKLYINKNLANNTDYNNDNNKVKAGYLKYRTKLRQDKKIIEEISCDIIAIDLLVSNCPKEMLNELIPIIYSTLIFHHKILSTTHNLFKGLKDYCSSSDFNEDNYILRYLENTVRVNCRCFHFRLEMEKLGYNFGDIDYPKTMEFADKYDTLFMNWEKIYVEDGHWSTDELVGKNISHNFKIDKDNIVSLIESIFNFNETKYNTEHTH